MAQLLTGTRIYGTGTVDTQLFVSGTNSATSTTTGALQVVGGVGIGGNLYVGGTIFGGIISGTASTATNADNVKTVLQTANASYYPTFVDANNSTAAYEALYTTSSFSINPGTGLATYTFSTAGNTVELLRLSNPGLGVSTQAQLTFYTASTLYGSISGGYGASAPQMVFNLPSATTGNYIWQNNSVEQMRINTSGQVGVGSNYAGTSGALFAVNGGTYLNGITTSTGILNRIVSSGTGIETVAFRVRDSIYNLGSIRSYNSGGYNQDMRFYTSTGTAAGIETLALTILSTGAVAFGTSATAYGVSGQILQSNGNAAPTWISTGSLAAANATTATHLSGGVAGQIPYQTAPGVTSFLSTGTAGDVLVSNGSSAATYNNTLRLAGSTNATSTTSGALQVVGGVGVGGDLFIQGDIRTNDTLFNLINGNATTVNFAGDATALTMGASGSGTTNVRNNLTVSGNLTVQGTTTIVDSTVTNIADPILTLGGGTGNSAPTADDNKDRGVAFKWVNDSGTTSTGFFGYDDSTGYFTYVQTATITNEVVSGTKGAMDVNLAGGTAMSIVYQSSPNNTAFLAASTSGYILQTNGTGVAPTWVSASGVSAGSAANADSVRTIAQTASATYYPTFVDSNNASNAYESVYTTSSFYINPATGQVNHVISNTASTGIYVATPSTQQLFPASGYGGAITVRDQFATATTSSFAGINFQSSPGNDYSIGKLNLGSTTFLAFYQANTPTLLMVLTASGNLGVGTTSPGLVSGMSKYITLSSTGTAEATAIELAGNRSSASQVTGRISSVNGVIGANAEIGRIEFQYQGSTTLGSVGIYTSGSERVRVDSSGNVLIGYTSITTGSGFLNTSTLIAGQLTIGTNAPRAVNNTTRALTIEGMGANTTGISAIRNGADANPFYFNFVKTRGTVLGGNDAVTSGDILGIIYFNGADGTTSTTSIGAVGATMQASVTGAVSAGVVPSAIIFSTMDATGSRPERLRITQNGGIAFGGASNYGSSGSVLKSNGDAAPTWVDPSTLASASATNADNIRTIAQTANASYYPTFVDSNNAANAYELVYTTSSFVINPQSGNVGIGTSSPSAKLDITGPTVSGTAGAQSVVARFIAVTGNTDILDISNVRGTAGADWQTAGFRIQQKVDSTWMGYMQFNGTAAGTNNYGISFGTGGSIVSANSVTERLRITSNGGIAFSGASNYGTSGQILQSNGDAAPTWISLSGITVGTSTQVNTVLQTANATYYPTFVDANNASATAESLYTTSSFSINPATGNVGIGTASPASVIHVRNGSTFPQGRRGGGFSPFFFENATVQDIYLELANTVTNYSGILFSRAGTGNYGLLNYNNATDNMVFYTSGTVKATITSAGGVAFGSSQTAYGTSGQLLQSNGNATPTWINQSSITVGTSTQVNTVLQTASATYYPTFVDSNNASATAESLYTTSSFVINPATGNVGFNKASPTESLYIERAGTQNLIFLNQSTSASAWVGMSIGYLGTEYFAAKGNVNTGEFQLGGKNASGYYTTIYSNNAETVRVTGGNVGIGTSSPGYPLVVQTNGTSSSPSPSGSNIALRLQSTQTNYAVGIQFSDNVTNATWITMQGGGFRFTTANPGAVQAMNISGSGNVSIGTTSTTNKFEVAGNAGQLFSVSDSFTGTIFSVNDVSGIPSIEALDTGLVKMAQYGGQVAINTGTVASSTASLSVYGMIYTMGTLGEIRASSEITAYYSSDRRLKENIKLIENPITIIDQIRGVTFDWTDEHMARRGGEDGYFVRKHDIGVIAQEVQAVLPELVGTREDGYLAVKYEKMVPLLIEAIKEQQKTIDILVKDLADVKEFINNLKNGI